MQKSIVCNMYFGSLGYYSIYIIIQLAAAGVIYRKVAKELDEICVVFWWASAESKLTIAHVLHSKPKPIARKMLFYIQNRYLWRAKCCSDNNVW